MLVLGQIFKGAINLSYANTISFVASVLPPPISCKINELDDNLNLLSSKSNVIFGRHTKCVTRESKNIAELFDPRVCLPYGKTPEGC